LGIQGAIDDSSGSLGQTEVVIPGIFANPIEGLIDRYPYSLSNKTLGLFDCDSAVQSRLELVDDHPGVSYGLVLEDPNRGNVGKSLRRSQVLARHLPRRDPEQVHRSQ